LERRPGVAEALGHRLPAHGADYEGGELLARHGIVDAEAAVGVALRNLQLSEQLDGIRVVRVFVDVAELGTRDPRQRQHHRGDGREGDEHAQTLAHLLHYPLLVMIWPPPLWV